MHIFHRCLALAAALIVTFLTIIGIVGPVTLPDLRSLIGLTLLFRLSLTPTFWEFLVKMFELSASIHDLSRQLPLFWRAWSVRHWLRWPLLRNLALHGGIALATIFLLVTTAYLLIGETARMA